MEHVAAVLSAPASAALPKVADFHTAHREVEDALRTVVDELRDGHPGRADLWSTLIELHQVQRELVEQRLVQRLEALDRVRAALGRLRELGPVSEILRHAPDGAERQLGARPGPAEPGQGLRAGPGARPLPRRPRRRRARGRGAARGAAGARVPGGRGRADAPPARHDRAPAGRRRARRTPPLPVEDGLSYVAAPVVLDGRADRLLPRRLRRSPGGVARARRRLGVRRRLRPALRARRPAPARARAAPPAAPAGGLDRRDGGRAVRGRDRARGRGRAGRRRRCAPRRVPPATATGRGCASCSPAASWTCCA